MPCLDPSSEVKINVGTISLSPRPVPKTINLGDSKEEGFQEVPKAVEGKEPVEIWQANEELPLPIPSKQLMETTIIGEEETETEEEQDEEEEEQEEENLRAPLGTLEKITPTSTTTRPGVSCGERLSE